MKKVAISRSVLIAGVIGAALAAGGFLIAPNHNEQRAMQQRNLYERAQLLYMSGDHESGIDILKRAVASGDVNAGMIRTLLGYYAAAGRAQEHFALLRSDASDMLNPQDLRSAISLYDQKGMNDAAIAMRRMLVRRGAASPAERATLAMNEAAAGRLQVAVNMANQIGRGLAVGADANTGATVVRVLTMANRRDLADAFLARWLTRSTSAATAMQVAPVLIDQGYPEYAVETLRRYQRHSPEAREIYVRALRDASARSPQLRVELTRSILDELPRTAPGTSDYNVVLHDLFAFGDMDLVISEMGQSGQWRDATIRPAFVYSLRSQGRTNQLASLLSQEAVAPQTGLEEARLAARDLAELGATDQAEAALMTIAAREGPQGQALNDLLYVWSQNRRAPDTGWFAARARQTQGAVMEQWISAVARGVSGRAAVATIDAVGQHPDAGARMRLAILKARYLGWDGDSPALRRALSATADMQLNANDAGEMARLACLIGDADIAARLSPRAIGSSFAGELEECANRFALLAARRALQTGNVIEALDRYAAVAASGQVMSAQDYFDYAEASRQSDRAGHATGLYEAALMRLPEQDEDADAILLRAAILTQMRRYEEARARLEAYYAANPDDRRAKVALIEFLLDRGDFQAALRLTNKTEATGDQS